MNATKANYKLLQEGQFPVNQADNMAFLIGENVYFVDIAVGAPQPEPFQLFQLRKGIKGILKAMPIQNRFLKD